MLRTVVMTALVACVLCPGAWAQGGGGGDFPALNVTLHAQITPPQFGAEFAEDCWGYVSPSGREYAVIGLSTGTGFVEITDPDNPVVVQVVTTPNRGRDMKVFEHHVYSTSDSGPLHIIDVSDIDNGNVTLVDSIVGGAHNLAINEASGHLYRCIGGPMVIVDINDPVNTVQMGTWEGEAHDAHVITYTEGEYAGREIAFVFAGWSRNVDIVDVTNKSTPFLVGSTTYPDAGYTHQGWTSDDRQYLYVSDELDAIQRTSVFDISDLSNPTYLGSFSSSAPSTDHNLYVRDGVIYEANYTGGLRIFDATCDPVSPTEIGYFDTFPSNDFKGFSGAWSNYPYFPSGTVIVSDRSRGLFVLDVSAALALVACSPCTADVDGDGAVGFSDLLDVLSNWGPCEGCAADVDQSGNVDFGDLLLVLSGWGPCS